MRFRTAGGRGRQFQQSVLDILAVRPLVQLNDADGSGSPSGRCATSPQGGSNVLGLEIECDLNFTDILKAGLCPIMCSMCTKKCEQKDVIF